MVYVYNSQVLNAGPMVSCWLNLLSLFLSFPVFSFSSFHELFVWVWDSWTVSVFTLSKSFTANCFKNDINNKILFSFMFAYFFLGHC